MSKQSSVEWFIKQIEDKGYGWENPNTKVFTISIMQSDYLELKRIVKEMHKDEIAKAFDDGEANDFYNNGWIVDGAKYYDKTFGDGNND